MAARALKKLDFAPIMTFKVAAGQAATRGRPVILSGSDNEIATAGANSDLVVGIPLESAVAGSECQVVLVGPVVPTLVGAGGSTRGTKQVLVADGVTDCAAHDSSGATDNAVVGIAMQSGVAGDMIGMIQTVCNRGSA